MQIRIDNVEIQSARIDELGFLQVGGVIGRVGVQEYVIDGQIVRELRPESEVIKSARTFVRKPVTLNHPENFVTAENTDSFMKGMTSMVQYRDGLLIDPEMTISHQDAIEAGLTTHKQVSCGYLVEVKPESGVWIDTHGVQGEKGAEYQYDAVQTNIRGNHVALVTEARAGQIASLKLDSDNAASIGISNRVDSSKITIEHENNEEHDQMSEPNVKVDQTDAWLARLDAAKAEITELTQKFDELAAAKTAMEAEKAELQGKVDAYEVQVKELEQQVKDSKAAVLSDEQIALETAGRVALWNKVGSHLDGVEVDYSKSQLEIKKLFLATKVDAAKVAEASEDAINGMWLVLEPKEDAKPESKTEAQKEVIDAPVEITEEENQDAMSKAEEARKKFAERLRDARKNRKVK